MNAQKIMNEKEIKKNQVKASEILHINSKYAYGSSKSNFTVELKKSIQVTKPEEQLFFSVVSSVIPTSWNNITSSNNTFTVHFTKIDGTGPIAKNCVIPAGVYNSSTFITVMQQQLNLFQLANDANGTQTASFVVEYESSVKIRIVYSSSVYKMVKVSFTATNKIYENFTHDGSDITASTTGNNSYVSLGSILNLSRVNELKIICTNLQTLNCYNNYTQGFQTILSNVLVTNPSGSYIYLYPHMKNSVAVLDKIVTYLNIRLVDHEFNDIDLNGLDWSLTLRVDYRDVTK